MSEYLRNCLCGGVGKVVRVRRAKIAPPSYMVVCSDEQCLLHGGLGRKGDCGHSYEGACAIWNAFMGLKTKEEEMKKEVEDEDDGYDMKLFVQVAITHLMPTIFTSHRFVSSMDASVEMAIDKIIHIYNSIERKMNERTKIQSRGQSPD